MRLQRCLLRSRRPALLWPTSRLKSTSGTRLPAMYAVCATNDYVLLLALSNDVCFIQECLWQVNVVNQLHACNSLLLVLCAAMNPLLAAVLLINMNFLVLYAL